ncbi:bifunctional ornithine acetyltransferase/N-acetylglutamate synthase, partial [Candidatus Margulisiibacteriota bacterium]
SVLASTVNDTFNMTSVDTDTSTNDMVLAFSTSEHKINLKSKSERLQFAELFKKACIELTKMMAVDGEGAKHLIEANVEGAVNKEQARAMALNIINSPLVKTAIAGADPNWGRIIAAAGKDPKLKLNPKKLELYIQNTLIFTKGEPIKDRAALAKKLQTKNVTIKLNLNLDQAKATAWGCDLTKKYIDINTAYS